MVDSFRRSSLISQASSSHSTGRRRSSSRHSDQLTGHHRNSNDNLNDNNNMNNDINVNDSISIGEKPMSGGVHTSHASHGEDSVLSSDRPRNHQTTLNTNQKNAQNSGNTSSSYSATRALADLIFDTGDVVTTTKSSVGRYS